MVETRLTLTNFPLMRKVALKVAKLFLLQKELIKIMKKQGEAGKQENIPQAQYFNDRSHS